MADTKLVIPDVLSGEGESKRMVRVRKTCDECGEPAVYRHTYLLPNGRSNPASSAYRHDDCSWCSDHEVFTCADCKRPRVDGYSHCSTFTIGERFAHLFLTWAEVSTPDPRLAAAEPCPTCAARGTSSLYVPRAWVDAKLAAAQGLADALNPLLETHCCDTGEVDYVTEWDGDHTVCSVCRPVRAALTAWEKAVR